MKPHVDTTTTTTTHSIRISKTISKKPIKRATSRVTIALEFPNFNRGYRRSTDS
uniref:Uncharacterized protein n=1 Tax=Utricularia reniformis TaxID=192314 RepID=A0A1Y0B4C1_9LAMI|nr:hypothetical protein AEK19_MT2109 [Utricularia reniformis]ART32262.1 hypothetical protein AEK19_MT2109 [Utricularia reniformis]